MRVSVIGPVSDDVRNALGAEAENDSEFKWIPGGLLITFPIEHAADANNLLRDGLNSFVDMAMARVRSAVSLEDHMPDAVDYVASVSRSRLASASASRARSRNSSMMRPMKTMLALLVSQEFAGEPQSSSTATIYCFADEDIEREVIALPDLQRPFVWEDTKVRDLLDSLFVGFPVGTLVFWHTSNDRDARALGAERPGLRKPPP